MTNCSIVGPAIQYLRQVNLAAHRMYDVCKGVNVMNLFLQFLQNTSRLL